MSAAPTIRPPQTHELKVWPGDFEAMRAGAKTADVRRSDDRKFRVGDLLSLREYDPAVKKHTGRLVRARITHVERMAGPRILCSIGPDGAGDMVPVMVLSFAMIST